MDQDPFATFMADHPKGSIIQGKVSEVDSKGAVVDIAEGVQGYIKANDLAVDRVEDASKVVSVGDDIEAKFVSIDRKTRQLTLSVRAKDDDELAGVIDQYQSRSTSSGTSLGDLLKEQLDKD
jgi:small subunit ribosomal protein S1